MDTDQRFNRIDDAIGRLATVSADLSKILAVQDQRLITCEKTMENMILSTDRRRDQVDAVINNLYNDIRKEIAASRENTGKQHIEQNEKIDKIQRMIYIAMGGATVMGFILPLIINKISIAFN